MGIHSRALAVWVVICLSSAAVSSLSPSLIDSLINTHSPLSARQSNVLAYPHTDIVGLVRRAGYGVETHYVETRDGYVLGVYRVLSIKEPKGSDSPPVILQHGLLDSGATWVVNTPSESLGFVLVDRGYDVWLANSRGNSFSRNHTAFDPARSKAFWDFTLDDMVAYDLPSTVEYVRETTGQGAVALVAHSQGAAVSLAAFSSESIPPDHISVFVALAPAVYLKYISSVPLQFLAKMHVDSLVSTLGTREFLPSRQDMSDLFGEFCTVTPGQCVNILTAICGFNEENVDPSRLPTYLAYAPSGTSVKNVVHWAQRVRDSEESGKDSFRFSRFDYGDVCETRSGAPLDCNQREYGRLTPPEYAMSGVPEGLKIGVFYGLEDKLADPVDVKVLLDELDGSVVFEKGLLGYEHIDFTWSKHAYKDVYEEVIHLLSTYHGAVSSSS
jgi:pimeloyl-ACP methyl ester carboxylesterase